MNKGDFFFFVSDVLDRVEGGESRNSRWVGGWVGEEGEGLCLQMLIVWMLNLHRNVYQMTYRVTQVAAVEIQMRRCLQEEGRREKEKRP